MAENLEIRETKTNPKQRRLAPPPGLPALVGVVP